jgi:hypothetical protein
MIEFKLLNLGEINSFKLCKLSFFAIITFIGLSGCAHVQPPNLNSHFGNEHFRKDIVVSFPAWISEDSKLAELDEAAKSKARIKCNNSPYSLIEIYSNRFSGAFSPSGLKNNAISANIQCGVTGNTSTASASSQSNRTNESPKIQSTNKVENSSLLATSSSTTTQDFKKQSQTILAPTANSALTTLCEAQQIIKFADGAQDCMSSYGFFNQTFDNKKAVMISFANERGKIAIAFSKDFKACPLSIINWSDTSVKALENCNRRIAQQAKDEKINPDSCQCEALVENGVTKFSKQEFERKINEYIATRSARLIATNIAPNAGQSIPMSTGSAPFLTTGSSPEKINKESAQTAKSVYALVIGNGQYKKAGLLNPINDANEIAKRFTQYGFTVKVVLDGDRKTLIRALGDFQVQSANYETNILFYAGHGIQFNGINYIIPTDMSLDAGSASIDFDAISTNQIVDKYMRGKTKLVFLDACRDNPLARTFVASRGVGSINKGLAPMDVASGTLISYATKDGNVAADGAGKNSPYTESLLKYLDNREDISLILRKVRQDVINKTKGQQVPWDYGSLVGGQLILSNK